MSAPDRLHIVLNAADGFEAFMKLGIHATPDEGITEPDIRTLLTSRENRLFRLLGWVEPTKEPVVLGIRGKNDAGFLLKNYEEPPFEAIYTVAAEPPPRIVQPVGDYIFELLRVAPE